jgi:hypothetical protein
MTDYYAVSLATDKNVQELDNDDGLQHCEYSNTTELHVSK